uniref:Uncharacterized protein n=1 Tax=Leersia perrieri TaxID=77586 RepID=A0A0D9VPS0_9ORYZ
MLSFPPRRACSLASLPLAAHATITSTTPQYQQHLYNHDRRRRRRYRRTAARTHTHERALFTLYVHRRESPFSTIRASHHNTLRPRNHPLSHSGEPPLVGALFFRRRPTTGCRWVL